MGDPNLMRDAENEYVIQVSRGDARAIVIALAIVFGMAIPIYGWCRAEFMLAKTERLLEQSEHHRKHAERLMSDAHREAGRVQSVLVERDAIYATEVSHER